MYITNVTENMWDHSQVYIPHCMALTNADILIYLTKENGHILKVKYDQMFLLMNKNCH